MTVARLPIHDRLTELADATRCRLLGALEAHELTVGELCSVLQLPQSTVSRHLRILSDEGWVESRADGTSRWYRLSPALDGDAQALWEVVRAPMRATAAAAQDQARVEAVVRARRSGSEAYFATAATGWDATRRSLFGARSDHAAMFALFESTWTVADLGCGTGELTAAIAPHVAHVHAVDASSSMLDAAAPRLSAHRNVTTHRGALEAIPLADATIDVAILMFVLHHVADPVRVLREARRVVKRGGRLLVADMRPHAHDEYRTTMGHVWLGFPQATLEQWLSDAGFHAHRYVPMPADADASGPALFTMITRAR